MLRSGNGRHLTSAAAGEPALRTLIRALAATAGLGVLEVEGEPPPVTGTLAAVLGALPVLTPPCESGTIAGAAASRLGWTRGAAGCPRGSARTVPAGVQPGCRDPGPGTTRPALAQALDGLVPLLPQDRLCERMAGAHRLSGGTIRRVAPGAVIEARAAGRRTSRPRTSRSPRAPSAPRCRCRWRPGSRSRAAGTTSSPETVRQELLDSERRCRHRERLTDAVCGPLMSGVGVGVRALFSGPSGTGKDARRASARRGVWQGPLPA